MDGGVEGGVEGGREGGMGRIHRTGSLSGFGTGTRRSTERVPERRMEGVETGRPRGHDTKKDRNINTNKPVKSSSADTRPSKLRSKCSIALSVSAPASINLSSRYFFAVGRRNSAIAHHHRPCAETSWELHENIGKYVLAHAYP